LAAIGTYLSGALGPVLSPEFLAGLMAAVGVINIILRFVTGTMLGSPEKPRDGGYVRPVTLIMSTLLAVLACLSVALSGCAGMSAESKATMAAVTGAIATAAELAAEPAWAKAREGCLRLEDSAAQTSCLIGVATAEAVARAAKAAMIPAPACPVTH